MTEVPGYHLDRLIGRGASGEVWLGRQRSAGGRVVAVKCLATADGAAPRQKLRVEGRVLAALDHPHIVTLYDVVERPGGVALIMQYAAGGSLASLLGQRRLTAGQVVSIAAPLADALSYAHRGGTVHGDVTPANVLFTDDGRPLLADFGIARVAARLSARSGLVGTPHYLDPQVALGAPTDVASDIYALGAICYEALAGRLPYVGATPFELLQRAREGDRPPLADLAPDAPASLIAAIDRALDPEPGKRFGDAAEFAAQLRAAATPEHVRMLPNDVPVPVGSPSRPTRDFGPRPPRGAPGDEPPRSGSWDRIAAATTSRSLRLGALGLLTATAVASVALLIAGVGDSESTAGARGGAPPPAPATSATVSTSGSASPGAALSSPAGVSPTTPTLDVPGASPSTADEWAAVLAALDARRARAYETADVVMIESIYAPGLDQQKDRDRVLGLAAAKQRVVGLRLNYRDVRVLTSSDIAATLDVIDELASYEVLDVKGDVVKSYPARAAKRWLISLKRLNGQWRIWEIAPGS
ncbi:MAG: serine/threonine-protein kinase [Mycobacteriales bacterium]